MRLTRLKKYRKQNQSLKMMFNMVMIGYLVLFSVSYLTSDTVAYFSGQQQVTNISITAGTWDDDSSDQSVLEFGEQDDRVVQTCPTTIEVVIHNNGDGPMQTEGGYDIYYIETGDVKADGTKLDLDDGEGVINILEPGETQTLSHDIINSGHYIFVVHPQGALSEEDSLWSEEIVVDCEPEETTEEVESEEDNAQNEPEKESQDEEKSEHEEEVEENVSEAEDEDSDSETTETSNETNTSDDTDESSEGSGARESEDKTPEPEKPNTDKTDEQNDASEESKAEDELENDDSTTEKNSKRTDQETKESEDAVAPTRKEDEDVNKHDEKENNEMDE